MYYREYRTQFHIGITYGISESRVCKIIKEIESILIKDSHFHLPDKKSLQKEENHFEVVLVGLTETPVERPKKTEVELFGQEKASYSKKTQIIADKSSRKIVYTAFDKGRRHDFKLFKNSKVSLKEDSICMADTGYQGLLKLHKNSELPKKKSKKNPLTQEDKQRNRSISSVRISIENIIRDVKIFRIIAEKYRNKRRCFALRFNLIAAIYNLTLI